MKTNNKQEGIPIQDADKPLKHSRIVKIIKEEIRDLEGKISEPQRKVTTILVNPLKINKYFSQSSYGQDALILYMLFPENYTRLLGDDAQLIAVGFGGGDNLSFLPEEQKMRIAELHKQAPEGPEIVEYVDRWLICYMIFEKDDGYIVAIIKQNAVNKPGVHQNGEKAIQQVCAYTAVVLGNVEYANYRHRKESGYRPLPEAVVGYLVAHTVDAYIKDYALKVVDRNVKEVSQEVVYNFLSKLKKGNGNGNSIGIQK